MSTVYIALPQLQAPSVSASDRRACGVLYFRFPLGIRPVEEMISAHSRNLVSLGASHQPAPTPA